MNRFLFEDDELTQNPMMAAGGGSGFKEPVAQSLAPKPDVADEIDLQALTDAAQNKRKWLNVGANVADALLNTRSAAEIMLGESRLNNNYGRGLREAADSIQDPVERQRKAFEYVKMNQEAAKAKEMQSPTSTLNLAARAAYKKRGFDVGDSDLATDLESRYGKLSDYALIDAKTAASEKERLADQQFQLQKMGLENQNKTKLAKLEADLKGQAQGLSHEQQKELLALRTQAQQNNLSDAGKVRLQELEGGAPQVNNKLAKLNSGDKARYDNATMGLKAIQSLDKALVDGNNTFSLIGDNDFTLNLDHAAEAFGRMQSGGAVNKDEEARFKRMAPRATDRAEVQRTKLEKMQALMADRLKTLGFTPEEAGVPVTPIQYGAKEAINKTEQQLAREELMRRNAAKSMVKK